MVSDEREKNGTNLLQLCHIAAVLESISIMNFTASCVVRQRKKSLKSLKRVQSDMRNY
jgi:hypothetical protein